MATNFPGALDSLADVVDNVDSVLASHHNNNADSIEALEAKVGVNNSLITSTYDYKIRNLPAQDGVTKVTNLNADTLDGWEWSSGDAYFSSNTSAPSGWTDVSATYNNKFIRISSSTPLSTGGVNTHNHGAATGSHTLTVAQMPSHTHAQNSPLYPSGGGISMAQSDSGHDNLGSQAADLNTASTGGGAGHTHSVASANNIPVYVQMRIFQKN